MPANLISERFAAGSLFLSATRLPIQATRHTSRPRRLFAVLDTLQEKHSPER